MNVPGGGGKPFAVVGCSLSGHKKLCVWGLSSEGEGVRVSYWVLNRVGLGVLDKPGWKGAEVSFPPDPTFFLVGNLPCSQSDAEARF